MLCYVLYIYVDLDTSTAARSSDSPEDEQLSLDSLVDDPQAEDDEDALRSHVLQFDPRKR